MLFYDWRNVRKPIVTIESQSAHPVHALSFQVRYSSRESTNIRSFEWSFSKSLLKERQILAFSCVYQKATF